jgi:hypothetical protein
MLFGGPYCRHLQGERVLKQKTEQNSTVYHQLLLVSCLVHYSIMQM